MKSKLFFLLLLFCGTLLAQQTKNALFLGNSYTYGNNLPQLIADVSQSKGDTFKFDSNTPGGYTLQGHSTNTTSLKKIKSGTWDVVIMQEQSQRPSFPPTQVAQETLPYAKRLADTIKKYDSCTIPMFFMTWGRKNGDAANCQFYPPVCTYEGMQNRLHDSYLLMGQQNNGQVSPVGAVWREVRKADSTIELYTADESHPNIYGSYLAACTFYSSVFHKSPLGAWYPTNVDSAKAYTIQTITHNTVFDSLNIWMIDTVKPRANYMFVTTETPNEIIVHLDASSTIGADSIHWDFGDGRTSSKIVDTCLYIMASNHFITLQAWRGCLVDSISYLVYIPFNTLEDFNHHFTLYPNPSQHEIRLENKGILNGILNYRIYNLNGSCIKYGELKDNRIKSSLLPNGIYVLEISNGEQLVRTKFVKE